MTETKRATTVTAGQVLELLAGKDGKKLPYPTLNDWVKNGIINPVEGSGGSGEHRRFSIMQVLAIAVGRGMRHNGRRQFSLEVAGEAVNLLLSMDESSLVESFDKGQTLLVVSADDKVERRLHTRQEYEKMAKAAMTGSRGGLFLQGPFAVDAKGVFDNINKRLKQIRS